MQKDNKVKFRRAGFGLMIPLILCLLLLFVSCGGGGGSTSTPGTIDTSTPTPDPEPTNSSSTFSGYLYAPINLDEGKLNGGMTILQTSSAPSGYRAVSGATVYLDDNPDSTQTTDSSGYFEIDLEKATRAAGGRRRVIAVPSSDDQHLAATREEVFPPYEGGEIQKLLLHPNARNIEVGETIQLYAVVTVKGVGIRQLPNEDVDWEVDDETLGTISDTGLFTGLSEGKALVTITYEEFTCTGRVHIKAAEEETYTLSGEVVYTDGTPASGAVLTIDGMGEVGIVDEDGNYEIPDLPANTNLTLSVYVEGECKYTKTIYLTGDKILNITLDIDEPDEGTLQGTVTDTDGNALANVLVSCGDFSTSTDENGEYEIDEIPEGSYTVTFTLQDYIPVELYAEITGGETTTLDATLQEDQQPVYGSIKGRVVDPQYNGISGATVSYEFQGQAGSSTTTDSNGFFTFQNLDPGVYTVSASKDGYDGMSSDVNVTAGEQVEVEITLTPVVTPTGSIAGTVKDGDGNVLSGVTVSAGGTTTTTDSQGQYTISDLDPGSYTVNFTKDGYNSVVLYADVVSGSTTTLNATLEKEDEPTTGMIEGKVIDMNGDGIANASVSFARRIGTSSTTTTDSKGNFSFQDVTPGDYRVTASKTGYITNYVDITVNAGQTSTCQIVLPGEPTPTGSIEGTVTDTDGNPLQGVLVNAGSYSTTTDVNGDYALSDVDTGTYTVTFSRDGYHSVESSAEVTENETTILDVSLEKIIVKSWQNVGNPGFSPAEGYYTSLFVYNGTPYVAFRDTNASDKASVMKYNGTSWEYVGSPGFSAGAVHATSLYVYNGTPYVAYRDYGNSEKATVMKYDGNSWVNVGSAGFSDYKAYYTSIFVYNGIPYVAYRDQEKATVMKFNSKSWEVVGSARFSASGVYFTSLFIAADGTPYLAYRDGGYSERATVVKFNGKTWEYVGSPGFSAGPSDYISLHVYNGTPYVAYSDWGNNGKATVMKYTGNGTTGWETLGSAGFSPSIVYYTSLYFDGATPVIAYSDYDYASAMYYDSTNGSWEQLGEANFSAGNARYVSLFIYGGIPYVAYTDYGYDAKVTVMKYDE